MNPKEALAAFRDYLVGRGLEPTTMTARQGVEAMISFYRCEQVEEGLCEDDADMLLFQWGTDDWGKEEQFEIDITRQLILWDSDVVVVDGIWENADDYIWQLSLNFRYPSSQALRAIRAGNRWCNSVDQVPDFEEFIHHSKAFTEVADMPSASVDLGFECAG